MASKDDKNDEYPSLKDSTTSDSAKIHGYVSSISPMKKGKTSNFFDAEISDGETDMRLVGFQQSQRKRLEDFHSTSNPVTIANCTIKKARASDDLEILLKSASKLK